jgi:ribA/ribD-fused uncharacterized protein
MATVTNKGFRGEYGFLSNFAFLETPLVHKGISYPTVEHFYQAAKTTDMELRREIAKHSSKGLKSFIRKIDLRPDWEEIKTDVMLRALRYKFSDSNPILRQRLLDTQGITLIEYNYWGDTFWGVCLKTNEGLNTLGTLLTLVRSEIEG